MRATSIINNSDVMLKVTLFMLEAPVSLQERAFHMGSHRVTRHPAEAAFPALILAVTSRYSIYPPIKDERLSRPEPMQVNDLPRVTKKSHYTRCQLVKLTFCPTRHSRCEQLAHNCYAVTGFSGVSTHVFQTRVKRTNHSATIPPNVMLNSE